MPRIVRTKGDDRTRLLDVLRGLLATWVVLHHVVLIGGFSPDIYPWRVFIHHGQEPVLVFFALSGFAISRSLWTRPQRWLSFLIARFWRIYPVYLVAMAIGIAVTVYGARQPALFTDLGALQILPWQADEGIPRTAHILLHLGQLHGLVPSQWLPHVDTSIVAPGWSLSTEFQFYALAPLLSVVLLRPWVNGNRLPALALLIVGLWPYFHSNSWIAPANILRYLDLFILGMIGAVMHDGLRRDRFGYSLLVFMVAVAGWHSRQIIVVTAVGVWLASWWCATLPTVNEWIDTRFGQLWLFVGALSFPLYILHYPVARLLLIAGAAVLPADRAIFLTAWMPATVVVSFAGAAALHRYAELPGTRYGKQLAARRERRVNCGHIPKGLADIVPAKQQGASAAVGGCGGGGPKRHLL